MQFYKGDEYQRFFNPLSCKNKEVYYECILRLIAKSKAVPVLYETDARDTLVLYLQNCTCELQEEDEGVFAGESVSSSKSEVENAAAVLRYFRYCGWLTKKEIGRNGDNVATVHPYCLKLIEAIERIFNRNNSAALTNYIFAIYDVLHSVFVTEHGRTHRPYSNILVPALDNVADLNNELLALKDSIRFIMKQVLGLTETNALGQFLLKNSMMEKFFRDYFFIKKDGMIPGYIGEIVRMLHKIRRHEVYGKMVAEYQQLYEGDMAGAKAVVDTGLAKIENFISYTYVQEMDYIDKKINSYYNLYATRILMVISSKADMQSYLNDLLLQLKDVPTEERNEILLELSEAYNLQSYGFIGVKSLARRKKATPNSDSKPLVISSLSEAEKRRMTEELLAANEDLYAVGKAKSYFEKLLQGEQERLLEPEMIKSRFDAMMMAACVIYSGTRDFGFAVQFLPGMLQTAVADIRMLKIKRMKK